MVILYRNLELQECEKQILVWLCGFRLYSNIQSPVENSYSKHVCTEIISSTQKTISKNGLKTKSHIKYLPFTKINNLTITYLTYISTREQEKCNFITGKSKNSSKLEIHVKVIYKNLKQNVSRYMYINLLMIHRNVLKKKI